MEPVANSSAVATTSISSSSACFNCAPLEKSLSLANAFVKLPNAIRSLAPRFKWGPVNNLISAVPDSGIVKVRRRAMMSATSGVLIKPPTPTTSVGIFNSLKAD